MRHRIAGLTEPIVGTLAATALFAPFLSGLAAEQLCIAYLDRELRLLDMAIYPPDHPRRVRVPLRTVVRDALVLRAAALVVAHNHPHGPSTPSPADRRVTRRLAEVVRALDLRLIDHLVFAGDGVASFRALALL